MNTNIKNTNLMLSEAVSEHVSKRLEKISVLLEGDPTAQCDIELARTTDHHNKGDIFRAEIHIVAAGKNLYAASEKEDIYMAFDDARDEILRELKSSREKKVSLIRRGGSKVKAMMKGLWPWGRKV